MSDVNQLRASTYKINSLHISLESRIISLKIYLPTWLSKLTQTPARFGTTNVP